MNRWGAVSLAILVAFAGVGCAGLVSGNNNSAVMAPSITKQPVSQTVTAGQTATFSVAVTGTAPLTYQWKKSNVAISGASSSSYTTPATTSSDNGAEFTVTVSNTVGNVTSTAATLTVNAPAVVPSITTQPVSLTVTAGQTATFTATAAGTAPLSYQWQKNGTAVAGATSSTYTTPATTSSDNGSQFRVVVSNAVGSVPSNAATLTVTSAVPPLQITTAQLPGGTLAGPYSATLNAVGGVPPYTWSRLSGALPSGLTLNAGGTISGTPTLAGTFTFVVQVLDAAAHTASGTFSINIVMPQPAVAITAPVTGATVTGTLSVTGTASDTVSLTLVQVSIDGGSFANASGTSNWSFSLNTTSLSNGAHTLTAKATDVAGDTALSSPVAVTVNNGALAVDCTLYASPSGNDGNAGTSPATPKTFRGAAAVTQPGSVVCLLGGTYPLSSTFYPPISGTPSAWIVYKNYGGGDVNFVWTGGPNAPDQVMIKMQGGSFPSNPSYLEFRGLKMDGQAYALDGFFCFGSHHLRFIGNTINNTGGAGVATVTCDYITADRNIVNHNGYLYGWTSGISLNSNQWFDNYAGFHNVISNNIIVGEYDGSINHTDGNGIILDLSNRTYDPNSANTPPALIINNVIYGNGGRCIEAFTVTNFWIVNNTCYKNGLDLAMNYAASLATNQSKDGYFINNITTQWNGQNPAFVQYNVNANIRYYANMYYGGSLNFVPTDPSQFLQADPLFVNPPYFDPTAGGQYATALPPTQLGNGLTLQLASPALKKGIDPSALPNLAPAIVADLKKYIYSDINGKPRPLGNGFDLGAYQISAVP